MDGNTPGESHAVNDIIIPCVIFLILSPLFVAMRIYFGRVRTRMGLGWDDWTIVASLAFDLANLACMLRSTHYGFGKHLRDISASNKIKALRLFYVAQILYKLNINLTKISILFLYVRIFIQQGFRRICFALLVISCAFMVASTCASIFQCTPIHRAWNRTLPGHCIDITKSWYGNAGYSIAMDLIILLLPMPMIASLQLPFGQKAALMFVFALGGFVTITSILRMTTISFSTQTPDTTYDIASTLWTFIEANVGIICACLPMCRPLLTLFFPRIFPSPSSPGSRRKGEQSESTGNPPTIGSARKGWFPVRGDQGDIINLATIDSGRGSQEHILAGDDSKKSFTTKTLNEQERGVKKSVQYSVTYSDKANVGTAPCTST